MKYTPYVNIQTNGYRYVVTYRDGKQVEVKDIHESIKLRDEEKERINNEENDTHRNDNRYGI